LGSRRRAVPRRGCSASACSRCGLAVEGIAMYAAMAWLEKRTTGWAHRSGFAAA
jgi:hypothetical protein